MQKYTTTGISFSNDILMRIDAERGLIPRSIFLRKILEQTYADIEVTEKTIQSESVLGGASTHSISKTNRIGDPKPNG